MKAAIVYWSAGGNTEKVARAIQEGLVAGGAEASLLRTEEAEDLDWYAYDLVCVGFPSYQWHPPDPVDKWLQSRFRAYRAEGRVRVGAPKVGGKNALVFCTYSGQHTGINEAAPAGKYAGQFFEHLGFSVVDEWYVVGQYHGSEEANTAGRMEDIRGRPNEEDLRQVREKAQRLPERLQAPESP
jgi:multimeric flavodoxin WrbA